MNITPFPTLSTATIDAINVIGQWLAQDDFSGEVPYQADCVILAGNAVMPTIAPSHSIRTTTLSAPLAEQKRPSWRISLISSGTFRMKKSGLKTSQQTAVKTHALASHY